MSGNALWQNRWSEDYALGDALVDSQHRAFFDEAAALRAAFDSDGPQERLVAYAEAFLANLRLHFTDEEALMERLGFPALAIHRQEHRQLLIRTEEVVAEIAAAECLIDSLIGTQTLIQSLVEHVTQQDLRIKDFKVAQCA
jgi:hemerythrin